MTKVLIVGLLIPYFLYRAVAVLQKMNKWSLRIDANVMHAPISSDNPCKCWPPRSQCYRHRYLATGAKIWQDRDASFWSSEILRRHHSLGLKSLDGTSNAVSMYCRRCQRKYDLIGGNRLRSHCLVRNLIFKLSNVLFQLPKFLKPASLHFWISWSREI